MDEDDPKRAADLSLPGGHRIPAKEIVELASRSSGPGGQHVNTSSTRVTLRWNLRETCGLSGEARARALTRLRPKLSREGVLIVHAGRHRSRERNRALARERLRELVVAALEQEAPRRPTGPTKGSKIRRLEAKRRRGRIKTRRQERPDSDD
jgi:ribosome-associated protein